MRKAANSLAILLLLSPFTAAQDPLEILKRVAARYATLPKTTYDFEKVEVREDLGGLPHQTELRARIAGVGGKYREEKLSSGILYIFDGQFNWAYDPEGNEYSKSRSNWPVSHAPGLSQLQIADYRVKTVQLLRQETLELASGPVVCQVIEADRESTDDQSQQSPITYWIDTSRNLVLKMNYRRTIREAGRSMPSESVTTVSFPKATVGQPGDETLFRFTAPEDAVQWSVYRSGRGPRS